MSKQFAVVFHCRTAPRGVDHERIKPLGALGLGPGFDHGPPQREGLLLSAHMERQCPTASCTADDDHLAAMTRKQTYRCGVDVGGQYLPYASGQERHPHPA